MSEGVLRACSVRAAVVAAVGAAVLSAATRGGQRWAWAGRVSE